MIDKSLKPKEEKLQDKFKQLDRLDCDIWADMQYKIVSQQKEFSVLITLALIVQKNDEYFDEETDLKPKLFEALHDKNKVMGILRSRNMETFSTLISLKLAETVHEGKKDVKDAVVMCIYEYLEALYAVQ